MDKRKKFRARTFFAENVDDPLPKQENKNGKEIESSEQMWRFLAPLKENSACVVLAEGINGLHRDIFSVETVSVKP